MGRASTAPDASKTQIAAESARLKPILIAALRPHCRECPLARTKTFSRTISRSPDLLFARSEGQLLREIAATLPRASQSGCLELDSTPRPQHSYSADPEHHVVATQHHRTSRNDANDISNRLWANKAFAWSASSIEMTPARIASKKMPGVVNMRRSPNRLIASRRNTLFSSHAISMLRVTATASDAASPLPMIADSSANKLRL
ncbi:hypothetical protein FBZ93_116132 [Bradyrhizobium macuxiense]|uniref:Uncharacterized protein n=1 Tax=Bradyrhizobium macuxiense TaxID=1755647 RepID=A0A560L1Y1_9BRAD|nr:hypothetical protein FBZ93_116132 [Bradyrhizobium macuxiense]